MTTATALSDPYRPAAVDSNSPGRVRAAGVFSASSWAELTYCVVGLAPALIFFVLTVTLLCVGVGLTVVYVGIPLMMLALLVARAGGTVHRGLARTLLDLPVPGPAAIRIRPGIKGLVLAVLADGAGWRALTYHAVNILLAPVRFGLAVGFYAGGLGGLTYPLWRLWLPTQAAADGSLHRGHEWIPDHFVDTPLTMGIQAALALGLLVLAPRVVRAFTTMDRVLIAGLLGG